MHFEQMVLARLSLSSAASAEPFADLPFPEFCTRYLRIQNKDGDIVPLQLNRAQRDLIAHLTGRDIVLKARQLGMSTVIQAWFFYHQMRGNERTNTLCHDDDLTGELRQVVDLFYNELPAAQRPERKYANAKLTTYEGLRSEGRIATVGGTAGKAKGRGGSKTRIHGSEVAYWPDAQAVMAAAMQAGNPAIVLESTANGATGYFYDLVSEALDGNSDWTLHFYPWWWDDEYRTPLNAGERIEYDADEQALVDEHGLDAEQIKWRRAKKRELKHLFIQEYPEDRKTCFIMSGHSYFGDIDGVFTAPQGAVYNPDHDYYGGVDWGQSVDFTVCSIIDKTADCQVALLRVNGLSKAEMRRRIRNLCVEWDVKRLKPEANSMGASEIESLRSEFRAHGVKTYIDPFWTDNSSKARVASAFYDAIHERGLALLNNLQQKRELQAFQAVQLPSLIWRLEGKGEHDDIVIADMLAEDAANGPRAGLMG